MIGQLSAFDRQLKWSNNIRLKKKNKTGFFVEVYLILETFNQRWNPFNRFRCWHFQTIIDESDQNECEQFSLHHVGELEKQLPKIFFLVSRSSESKSESELKMRHDVMTTMAMFFLVLVLLTQYSLVGFHEPMRKFFFTDIHIASTFI